MKFDYIIIGAGLSGCTIAEQLSHQKNKHILIIEQRKHIAGNCYDYNDMNNTSVHLYGPHIFHTNSEEVWQYLSKFTKWLPYQHKVLAYIDGNLAPIPFNINTIYQCFPKTLAKKIEAKLLDKYEYNTKIPILKLKEENDDLLKLLADYIYEKVFLQYTTKQWGMSPEMLNPSVTARVPVFISRDNRYFQDKYQGMPIYGYTQMVKNMIDKPNIHLLLNTNFFEIIDQLQYGKLFFTGMLDEFYGFKFGKLPYRTLQFEFDNMELDATQDYFQPVATVNYPNDYNFTRITEFKHFIPNANYQNKSAIVKEYPTLYKHNTNEMPFYPIPQPQNEKLAEKYKTLAQKEKNIIFLGRLADYQYYNMDQVVARALYITKEL